MSNLKEIHARVNTDLHKYVKEKAKAQNKTISDVIEDMILHDIKIESRKLGKFYENIIK